MKAVMFVSLSGIVAVELFKYRLLPDLNRPLKLATDWELKNAQFVFADTVFPGGTRLELLIA
ncbi:hypothetical protein [Intestinimonas butyriciproducens]|uniref:hypothetical protein n=1 Tax=Intestinimonas butyriciproducens TaxID=1297617 RepID=UPI0010202E01|nr:hypothetical protein [Intestinimonas butyriciproducens]MCR1907104.1 hypothetical protein [Intestinimonas butyriciproducens]